MDFRRSLLLRIATKQSVPTERYICGYSAGGTTVGFSIDGGADYLTATASTQDGYWRIDIPADTTISSLEAAFSADNFNSNYNITYIDLSHIGSLVSCTSMADMFKNCSALTGVTFPARMITPRVTAMTAMFNSCVKLKRLDVSMLDTSGITPTSAVTGMSNFLYMNQTGALEELSLPEMKVYVSSNFFYNCTNLTSIVRCGTIHQRFKIYQCPLNRASAIVLLNALSSTPPASNPTIHFSPQTYSLLTAADIRIATNKGWSVVNGN